ncbi:CPBP family intramembrane glutamic endopeptidase [Hazenella coriacea]|uniref:CAAX prenyl protease 2/Lysostaphin resistance protein A-like domain-containing protein n=1 Tax=Hazenella coriacea TaxID=1179467 RepID=A0A4R3LCL5_9BACL|nr:type II CAAX endopeptidase family protein [Hazenella coriacea]TCS97030.1 hypothetical protein EDD58_101677 [Hazenella coriacea]
MLLKIGEVMGKILFLILLFTIIFALPVSFFMDELLLSGIWQNIAFVIAVLTMYTLFETKRGWSLGLQQSQPILHFFKGAGLGILLMSLAFGFILLLGGAKIEGFDGSLVFWKASSSFLALFVMVAIGEEVVSRGYIQGLLRYRFSTMIAWIVSSLLFALMHSLNPGIWEAAFPIINLFLAGILFAVYRDVSGGIWGPIGLHFTWNFFQGPIFGFRVSGLENTSLIQMEPHGSAIISGSNFGAEGSLLVTAILIGAILWYRRKFYLMQKKETNTADL